MPDRYAEERYDSSLAHCTALELRMGESIQAVPDVLISLPILTLL